MDVIALHSAGFTNAVATLGTAITAEQARMMSRYTKKVIISYDADEAGQKAAMRAIKMLGDVGLDVTILKIPGAKDPDEYIKSNGSDKFKRLLESSKSRFDYNMENILSKYDINVSADKIKASRELVKLISETYSSAERDIYIQIVSKALQLEPKSIKADVDRAIAAKQRTRKKEESQKVKQDAIGYSDRVNRDYIKAPAVAKNEEHVLGLLFYYPEYRKKVFDEALLSADDFFTDLNRRFFVFLEERYKASDDSLYGMNEVFNEEEIGRAMKMKTLRMQLSNSPEILLDSIKTLKAGVKKKNSESANTYEALNELIKDKNVRK